MSVSTGIALLMIISAAAIVAKISRIPYTPLLVLAGTIMGFWKILPTIQFTPELLFTILLPPLLFEGSIRLSFATLKKTGLLIFLLAGPGVLLSILMLGPLFHAVFPFSLPVAFLLAALLAATDPVAVLATFRSLRTSEELAMLVEGESLFNDGTAMVAFGIILAILQNGRWEPAGNFLGFFLVSAGGIGIGLALGLLLTFITRRLDDHFIEITLTTILAYGSYLTADFLHVSGILAVIAGGIVYGNLTGLHGASSETKEILFDFWEYLGFLVNSIIFLLIGTQVNSEGLLSYWKPVAVVYLLLMGTRLIMVALSWGGAKIMKHPFNSRWLWVAWWGGLRGALSLALAMALPAAISEKKTIFFITLGVVFVFLFVNGLTTGPLLRCLLPEGDST